MNIKHPNNLIHANNLVQPIHSNQHQQNVMVDNLHYPDNNVQHIDHNHFAQPEDILLPISQPKLVRESGYYLKRDNNN